MYIIYINHVQYAYKALPGLLRLVGQTCIYQSVK